MPSNPGVAAAGRSGFRFDKPRSRPDVYRWTARPLYSVRRPPLNAESLDSTAHPGSALMFGLRLPPRQHRPAVAIAWGATLVSVVLVVVSSLRRGYDPQLSVLTATLVAVIWYTYFTYRAVNRTEPAQLFLAYEGHRPERKLQFRVRNPAFSRSMRIALRMRLLRQGNAVDVPEVLSAAPGTEVYLRPQESFDIEVPVAAAVPVPGATHGPLVQLGEPAQFCVLFEASWVDDLGESGSVGPIPWAFDVLSLEAMPLVQLAQAEAWFGHWPQAPEIRKAVQGAV